MPVPVAEIFGTMPDGTAVHRWHLGDSTGTSVSILSLGALIQAVRVPAADADAATDPVNVVLGFDNLADYVSRSPFFGCVVGRFANRIAGGRFELDGKTYELPVNDGVRPNTLHGGTPGFGARVWEGRGESTESGDSVLLTRVSPDGEEGFPGTLTASVRYTLSAGRLTIDYQASSDAPTIVNLTNHAHFNLAGEGAGGTILDHSLSVLADSILPVDDDLIPLRDAESVSGTPFDFRSSTLIGARLDDVHPQLRLADGYDHNYVLTGGCTDVPREVAVLRDPDSGRSMSVATTEPGLQVYICQAFDGSLVGTGGQAYPKFAGVALETQHFPDSPNRPTYPSVVLRPGETFRSTTVYSFA